MIGTAAAAEAPEQLGAEVPVVPEQLGVEVAVPVFVVLAVARVKVGVTVPISEWRTKVRFAGVVS